MKMTLILSLPATVCTIMAFLLILNLLSKWNKPQFKLLVFMLVSMLLYTAHFFFFKGLTYAIPFSDTIYCFCNPAVYPLFYIYVEELTVRHPNRLRHFFYLLPALVCFVAVGGLYLMMSQSETTHFIERYLYHDEYMPLQGPEWWQGLAHLLVKIVFALEIPPVLYYGWKRISEYNHIVENNYSDIEDKAVSSLRPLLILLAGASIVSFICNAVGRYHFSEIDWLVIIPAAVFSLLFLLIGHVGLNQQFSACDMEWDLYSPEDYGSEYTNELSSKLVRLLNEEQFYLKPNLKINDLARRLNTNRNYIYNAINVEMGISFSELINRKRIDYAVRMIDEYPTKHLNEVAVESGFSSISTFYRNFKLYRRCSPSDFQLEVIRKQKL